ncbi:MAG TPA: hypothetical protein VGO21_03560, partial [Candidatus Paceibacterota bacterium]|nr:hypothetical protein [Candidatus Paceibacterota bacterium]
TLFNTHSDGGIEPKQRIRIGGVTFGPGVTFGNGVLFAGVDLSQFRDRDFEVETDGDVLVIKGAY